MVYKAGLDSIFIAGTQQDLTDLILSFDSDSVESAILCNETAAAAGYYRIAFDSYLRLYHAVDGLETDEGMLQKAMVGINMLRIALDCDLLASNLFYKGIIDNQIEHVRQAGMLDRYLMYDYYAVFTRYMLYADLIKEAGSIVNDFETFMDREFPDPSPQRSEFYSLKGLYQAVIDDYAGAYESYKLSINPYVSLVDKIGVTLAGSLCRAATFLMDKGDNQQAFSLASDAFNILHSRGRIHDADYKGVNVVLATYKANEGDFDTAIRILDETIENDRSIHQDTGLHYCMLASRFMLNVRAKRADVAMDEFARLTDARVNKRWCNLHLTAGISELYIRFLLDLKKYDDALELLENSRLLTEQLQSFDKRGYYQDFARCYLGLGKYGEASQWYQRMTDGLKEKVKGHFTCFAEKQREIFWQREGGFLLPILAHVPEGTPEVGKALFNSALFSQGLLLKTSTSIASAIASGSFGEQQEKLEKDFAVMRDLKAKTLFDQDNIQLAATATMAERDIMQRLGLDLNSMSFVDNTWQHVKQSLKENEIAITFVYAGEGWGSIDAEWNGWYAAEIISNDFDEPVHVPLFKSVDLPLQLSELWSKNLADYIREGNTIYFVPAGKLHSEPLESLPFHDQKLLSDVCIPVRLSSMHELIDRHDFDSTIDLTKNSVMYGGLNYNLDVEGMELIAMENAERGPALWSYLPGTLDEVNAISESVGRNTRRLTGDEGIEETFKSLSGVAPNIIHIATHGYYRDADEGQATDPAKALVRCGLLLSGANNFWERGETAKNDQIDDGVLTGAEIASLDLSGADLVAMSACQTGLGEVSTEGVFGLQRAFKLAGAKSLLVTLREVNDQVTVVLMKEFYSALAAGHGRRTALRIAQEKVRESTFEIDGKTVSGSDPRFWACFVLID